LWPRAGNEKLTAPETRTKTAKSKTKNFKRTGIGVPKGEPL